MSKEYLETLEKLKEHLKYEWLDNFANTQYYDVLKQALQRLESTDNANPSEALAYIDAFIEENNNDIKNQDITGFDIDTQAKWVKYLEHKSLMLSTIKQALLKAQEQEKVLNEALKLNGEWAEELDDYKDLEDKIGCPLEVVFKLVNQNELYYQFYDELQHWTSVKVDLRKKVVWYCKQVGGHYACSQPLSNYGKTFWLKKDKSE